MRVLLYCAVGDSRECLHNKDTLDFGVRVSKTRELIDKLQGWRSWHRHEASAVT